MPDGPTLIGLALLLAVLVLIPIGALELVRLLHGWVDAKRHLWSAEAAFATRLGGTPEAKPS